jgi:hypothetical protein
MRLRFIAVPTTLQRYFQQIRPIEKCNAEDGRVVGHMLHDLVSSKPKDPARSIREFAHRTAMLPGCGFAHIGDMLVAMLAANAHTMEHVPREDAAGDPAFATAEQATALGCVLAAPASALQQVVGAHSILRTMKTRHAWFVPMLEILLEAVDSHRPDRVKRLSASVAPQAPVDVSKPNFRFDSVVRAPFEAFPRLTIASLSGTRRPR